MTAKRLSKFDKDMLIFGCGTMASAMLARWLDAGIDPDRVTAIRASGAAVIGGVRTKKAPARGRKPDILIIGVKPQSFGSVTTDIANVAGPDTVVISIMAGITLDDLRFALPDAGQIVRIMPNMPVAQGRGVVITVSEVTAAPIPQLAELLAPLGHVHAMQDEAGFNLVTALTGCGPAFVYRFVSALAGAAVRLGLNPEDAETLARATVDGAVAHMAATQLSPAELATAVASPGGMTQAGLDVLDSDGRLASLLAETLRAARDRGREITTSMRTD